MIVNVPFSMRWVSLLGVQVKSVLKEGGKFILTVPIGPDMVVWNLQRRYGRTRLPLLLEGWEEV